MEQMQARTLIEGVSHQIKMLHFEHPKIGQDECKDLAWLLFKLEAEMEKRCDVYDSDIAELRLATIGYVDCFMHNMIADNWLWADEEKLKILARIQSLVLALSASFRPVSGPTKLLLKEDDDLPF